MSTPDVKSVSCASSGRARNVETKYEPVLCDFDGTLADSEPVILAAITSACAEVGVAIPEGADLRACVGPPLERIFPEVLGADVPVPELIAAYRRHYTEVAPSKTELMPGALDAIEAWIDNGIRVGIVSYKPLPVLQVVLGGLGLTPLLSVLRAPPLDEPPQTKAVLLRDALEALRPFRAQPVYIGDHQDDETAAVEVGVDFIRYPDRSWQQIQGIVVGSRRRGGAGGASRPRAVEYASCGERSWTPEGRR